jgi:hypothetical protein
VRQTPDGEPETTRDEETVNFDVVDHVVELHPGCVEPFGRNVTTDVTVEESQETTDDGIPIQRKLVRLVVQLPDSSSTPPSTSLPLPVVAFAERPTSPAPVLLSPTGTGTARPRSASRQRPGVEVVQEPIESRSTVSEDAEQLPNGSILKKRTVTVTRVRPIKEYSTPSGGRRELVASREEVVERLIDDKQVELPPGVADEFGDGLESTSVVRRTEDVSPDDGVPVKRKTTETKVKRVGPDAPSDAEIMRRVADGSLDEIVPPSPALMHPTRTSDTAPEVAEYSRCLADGTVVRRVAAVSERPETKLPHERLPVTVDDEPTITIDTNILAIPSGTIKPNGDNVDAAVTMKELEKPNPGGGKPIEMTVTSTVVSPKRTADGRRNVEGAIEPRRTVTEDCQSRPDGTTVKRKVITVRRIRPVFELQLGQDGVERQVGQHEETVDATVEENILELPAGVIEPSAANCDTDITVSQVDDHRLEDGTPASLKVVRMIVRLRDGDKPVAPTTTESKSFADQAVETYGENVRKFSETKESEDCLEDGSTIRRKVITTRHVEMVRDAPGQPEREGRLVRLDVEDHVIELPPGVIEPHARNCDTDIDVRTWEEPRPDLGADVVSRRKSVKMTVSLKSQPPQPPLEEKPKTIEPSVKTIEGEVVDRVDVSETERQLPDGTVVRTRTETTRRLRPVTEMTVVDGVPSPIAYREQPLGAHIRRTIVQLGPGVAEPNDTDPEIIVEREGPVDSETALADGTRAPTTTQTTAYRLRRPPSPRRPEVTRESFEGAVEPRTSVEEDVSTRPDGTTVRRHTATTRMVKPNRIVTKTDGVVTDTAYRDVLIRTEIDEKIVELPPGVTDVNDPVVETRQTETTSDEVQPDGTPVRRRLVRVVATRRRPKGPPSAQTATATTTTTTTKRTVTKKVRRMGPDGELVEETVTVDEDDDDDRSSTSAASVELSPACSETDLAADDYGTVGVFADVYELEPSVETDVQEYDDAVLPDSTAVRKRVTTTTERRTVVMRALLPVDDDEQQQPDATPVLRYTDVSKCEPETVGDLVEKTETLPNGQVVRHRVQTTGRRQLTAERTLLTGRLDDESFKELEVGQERPTSDTPTTSSALAPGYRGLFTQISSTSGDDLSSRLILRRQIHKRTIIRGDKEETRVTETTHVEQDADTPAELTDSIKTVINEFMASGGGVPAVEQTSSQDGATKD